MTRSWNLNELAQWRHKDVVSADNVRQGQLEEIIYEFPGGDPVWLRVSSLHSGVRLLFIPVEGAVADGDQLRVAYPNDQIHSEPPADFGEGFDEITDERHLYQHFGMPLAEDSQGEDFRVLRAADDLPGQERNF